MSLYLIKFSTINKNHSVNDIEHFCAIFPKTRAFVHYFIWFFWLFFTKYINIQKCSLNLHPTVLVYYYDCHGVCINQCELDFMNKMHELYGTIVITTEFREKIYKNSNFLLRYLLVVSVDDGIYWWNKNLYLSPNQLYDFASAMSSSTVVQNDSAPSWAFSHRSWIRVLPASQIIISVDLGLATKDNIHNLHFCFSIDFFGLNLPSIKHNLPFARQRCYVWLYKNLALLHSKRNYFNKIFKKWNSIENGDKQKKKKFKV